MVIEVANAVQMYCSDAKAMMSRIFRWVFEFDFEGFFFFFWLMQKFVEGAGDAGVALISLGTLAKFGKSFQSHTRVWNTQASFASVN